jgi:hypothetical protein
MRKTLFGRVLPVILAVPLFLGIASRSEAQAPGKPVLTVDDCVKCHAGPPADIASAGAKHKTITCFDCHASHRPASKDNIPKCGDCHSGKPHFELKGCLGCHKNPHTPLKIEFGNKVTDPCLTCHNQQIAQLKENRSKHTELFCSTCHTVHRVVPPCVQCHKPHSTEMVQADCKKCHKAHKPKVIAYGSDVPNKDCAACHQKAYSLLVASKAKHKSLACVLCHVGKHKMVPECQGCHGVPHAATMMAKFTKCYDCHYIAHDLNNWAAAPKKGAPQETKPDVKEPKPMSKETRPETKKKK